MLTVLGYSSQSAANGVEALNLYRKNPSKFDGVILDLVMPVMGGEETLKQLIQQTPDLPTIITTGYLQEERLQPLYDLGIKDVLSKPFKIEQLETMLKQYF